MRDDLHSVTANLPLGTFAIKAFISYPANPPDLLGSRLCLIGDNLHGVTTNLPQGFLTCHASPHLFSSPELEVFPHVLLAHLSPGDVHGRLAGGLVDGALLGVVGALEAGGGVDILNLATGATGASGEGESERQVCESFP